MAKVQTDGTIKLHESLHDNRPLLILVHRAPWGCISYRALSGESGEILTTGITDLPRNANEREAFIKQVVEEAEYGMLAAQFDSDQIPF